MKVGLHIALITIIVFSWSLSSCKKESFTAPKIPSEFIGPEQEFNNLHDNWRWLYSNSPATIGPPSTGPISMQIWNDSIKFQENGIETFYLLRNTLEPDSVPYLHCFLPETGEYKNSIAITFFGIDTVLLNVVNSLEGVENDAVFKRE